MVLQRAALLAWAACCACALAPTHYDPLQHPDVAIPFYKGLRQPRGAHGLDGVDALASRASPGHFRMLSQGVSLFC